MRIGKFTIHLPRLPRRTNNPTVPAVGGTDSTPRPPTIDPGGAARRPRNALLAPVDVPTTRGFITGDIVEAIGGNVADLTVDLPRHQPPTVPTNLPAKPCADWADMSPEAVGRSIGNAFAVLKGTQAALPDGRDQIDRLMPMAQAIARALPKIDDPKQRQKAANWLTVFSRIPTERFPDDAAKQAEAKARLAALEPAMKAASASPAAQKALAAAVQNVHLHGMWYRPDMQLPGGEGSEKFRTNLLQAYLEFYQLAPTLPPNVGVHLWTDRKSPHALLMPFVGPGGTVIEVPHSQLLRDLVHIHDRDELEALIDQQPASRRETLRIMFASPLGANIGARTDLERGLHASLYEQGASKTQLNAYIDLDTLSETREYLRAKEVLEDTDLDRARFLGYRKPQMSARLRRKIKHKALQRDIEQLRMPPAPAGELSGDDIGRLVNQPKAQPRQARPLAATRPTVAIPEAIVRTGYETHKGDVDFLAMVPGSAKGTAIADKTRALLQRKDEDDVEAALEPLGATQEMQDEVDFQEEQAHTGLWKLAAINGESTDLLSHDARTDYFRLACRIAALKPLLDQRVDELKVLGAGASDDAQAARNEASGIEAILAVCAEAVEHTVNSRTYPPLHYHHDGTEDPFDLWRSKQAIANLATDLFGDTTHHAKTGTWQTDAGKAPGIRQVEEALPQLRQAMKSIKRMLAGHEAETREGSPQRLA